MKKTELKKSTQKFLEIFCIKMNKKIQKMAKKRGLDPELFYRKIPDLAEREEYHAIFQEAKKFRKTGECAFLAFTIEDMNDFQEKKQKKQEKENFFLTFFDSSKIKKEAVTVSPIMFEKLKNRNQVKLGLNIKSITPTLKG